MKDALFDLIGTLTRSEKRYFKLLASRHTIGDENNYVTLFNFIEKQANYNEEAIFQKFNGQSFLNNFSITKKRLYDNILLALESFHSNNSEEAMWTRQLHSAEILMGKNLFNQAKKIIHSIEKQAIRKENNLILQKIHRLKNNFQAEFGLQFCENNKATQSQHQQASLKNEVLYCELLTILHHLRTHGKMIEFQVGKNIPISIENQLLLQQTQLLDSFRKHQSTSTELLVRSNLELFERHPELIKRHFYSFLELHRISILIQLPNEGYHKTKQSIHQLIKIAVENENQKQLLSMFQHLLIIEIELFSGHYAQASLISNDWDLERGQIHKELRVEILFKLACINFLAGNYSKALGSINLLLQDLDDEVSERQSAMIHVLDCLIHYELRHEDYLHYAIKNSLRQLKGKSILLPQHKTVFSALSKLISCKTKIDKEEVLLELQKNLAHESEEIKQQLFPVDAWLVEKLKNPTEVELSKLR